MDEAEKGNLSLNGVRKDARYQSVEVVFLNQNFEEKNFTAFSPHNMQHKIDHYDGIII